MDINIQFLHQLESLEQFIFDNEDSFLKFCGAQSSLTGLIQVYFYINGIKYYYILENGQHITDNITWNQYRTWVATLRH